MQCAMILGETAFKLGKNDATSLSTKFHKRTDPQKRDTVGL